MNSAIWSNYSNTKYLISNSIQNFGKMKLTKRYLSHARHFVPKICETIQTFIRSNYSKTRILFGVPKNLNTKCQILFSIDKILIPNMNTTIWSNYSNIIRIPNYLSHPEGGVREMMTMDDKREGGGGGGGGGGGRRGEKGGGGGGTPPPPPPLW